MKDLLSYDKIHDYTYLCWCDSRDVVKFYANEYQGEANVYGFCQWHDPSSHPCYAVAELEEVDAGMWALVQTVGASKLVDHFKRAKDDDHADRPDPVPACRCRGHKDSEIDLGDGVVAKGNFVQDDELAKQMGKMLGLPAGTNVVFVGAPEEDEESGEEDGINIGDPDDDGHDKDVFVWSQMNPEDFYFGFWTNPSPDPSDQVTPGVVVTVTPKSYFDKTGYIWDETPDMWAVTGQWPSYLHEVMEAMFEVDLDLENDVMLEKVKQDLISIGLIHNPKLDGGEGC